MPGFVIFASFVGFGALVRESGLSLAHGLASTATGWALPGQIALVELYSVGAPLLAIALAVALTNARLLPMTVAVMPWLRGPGVPRWLYYLAAHWIAVTGWAQAMRVAPLLPAAQRLPYFLGFSMVLWPATLVGTALGFFVAGSLPLPLVLGLVFVNPIYFMLVFAADLKVRPRVYAMLLGALTGPLFFLVSPDWGLMLTGFAAGTAGFLLGRARLRAPRWRGEGRGGGGGGHG